MREERREAFENQRRQTLRHLCWGSQWVNCH